MWLREEGEWCVLPGRQILKGGKVNVLNEEI